MNTISTVTDDGISRAIMKEEFAGDGLEGTSGQSFWNMSYAIFGAGSGSCKQFENMRRGNFHARIHQQLEGFVQNSIGKRTIQQLQLGFARFIRS